MPLDISLLENLSPDATASALPPEDAESRVDTVLALVTQSKYVGAARAAEALLGQGVRDVRLVGPYLLGAFLERGLEAMPVIFASLARLLTTHWESFGPPDTRSKHAQSGVRWLLKTLNKHFDQQSLAKDDTWRRWSEPSIRQPLKDALTLAGEVTAALKRTLRTLPESNCEALFTQLVNRLSDHLRTLPQEPPPPAQAPEHAPAAEHAALEEEDVPTPPPSPVPPTRAPAAPRPSGPTVLEPVSPALALLMRKLDAFDALVERGDLGRASVVASDLIHTLDHFDPRVYLPNLFTPFFGGLSKHADAIERLLQSTDSLAFRALEQLYRVDLDAFLAQDSGALEE
jgi:hypothetical protein